jgi:hypothetical protein
MSITVNSNRFVELHPACGFHHDLRMGCPLPEHLEVDVTAADIAWGKPCVGNECAVALAVKRKLHNLGVRYVEVSVTERDIHIVQSWAGPARHYAHDAADLVKRFDALEPVEPQSLHLEVGR